MPQRNIVQDLLGQVGNQRLGDGLSSQLRQLETELDADSYMANPISGDLVSVVVSVSFNPVQEVQYGSLPESIVDSR